MKNFVVEVGDTLSSSTPSVLRPAVLQQLSMKVAFLISHKINQDPQTNFHPQIKLHARFMKKYQTVNCMCQVRIQGAKILISRDRISSFHINGQNWTFTSPKFQHPNHRRRTWWRRAPWGARKAGEEAMAPCGHKARRGRRPWRHRG